MPDQPVVLVCSDVARMGPGRIRADDIAAAVRERVPAARVSVMAKLCSGNDRLPFALRVHRARRVIVGCRRAAVRRTEIAAGLRRAGIHPAGTAVVDLSSTGRPDPGCVARQSASRLAAAVARVMAADVDAAAQKPPVSLAGPVPRLSLFHLVSAPERPDHLSILELEAAARVLVAEALRPGPGRVHGVAIVCADAAVRVPVGAEWLPLEVPSLELVTTGWPLQILSAGTGVAFAGCDRDGCAGRASELDGFCAELDSQAAAGWRRLNTQLEGWAPSSAGRPSSGAALDAASITLREPEATAGALAQLASRPSGPGGQAPSAPADRAPPADVEQARPWRIESAAIPLGQITVDTARCSACGCCVHACPTGAIGICNPSGHTLGLSFNAAQCTACGACASACPERAITVRRAADSTSITADRTPLAMVAGGGRCVSCGQPLAGGFAGDVIALRLAASHPEIAARLYREDRCTDCLLISPAPERADRRPGEP